MRLHVLELSSRTEESREISFCLVEFLWVTSLTSHNMLSQCDTLKPDFIGRFHKS